MTNSSIDICLATYNGAKWLEEFLYSLKNQSHQAWRLIVSDDGSSDESLDILKSFFCDEPSRLEVVKRVAIDKGIVRNFNNALVSSRADYILLADQDDVWLPEKLDNLLSVIKQLEGSDKFPALVFSDMVVVDDKLTVLSDSWWSYTRTKPQWALSFRNLLCQNNVPGCAIIINRRLLDYALPIPAEALMHDWWLLLVSAAIGKIAYCQEKTLLYRRHHMAATYIEIGGVLAALRRLVFHGDAIRKDFNKTTFQALAFKQIYENKLSGCNLGILEDYIRAPKENWFIKRWLLVKNRIRKPTITASFRFYFWV